MKSFHFHVTARELLLDLPERCPFYPHLCLQGIAVTPHGHHYLILDTPAARAYAGPDSATVERRAMILASALRDGEAGLASDLADATAAWIQLCWDSTLDELVDAFSDPLVQF